MNEDEERAAIAALTALARRQYGLLTLAQVMAQPGLSRRRFERRVRSGWLVPVQRGIWSLPGSPALWRRRVMAVCLAYGPPVAASHTTAGRLWGLEVAPARAVHVTVPRNRNGQRRTPDLVTHHARLDPQDMAERYGLPVTGVARTLVDLAPTLSAGRLGSLVDDALRRRIVTISRLAGYHPVARRAGPGLASFNRLVADRLERGVGDSPWEDRVFGWLVDAGLPAPVRQHPVDLADRLVLLDLAYPAEMVAVEFDGYAWHGGRRRFDLDRARASELTLAGWVVIRVTSNHTAREVVDWVRRALQRSGETPRVGLATL